ncbi:tRNA pseudouridine(38-40) synthase TruA [Pelagibacteraceae bacterium]|nr:tRNA pseudouridine(38-40) synthase TruA [Pelagibacteraceae bacterium]
MNNYQLLIEYVGTNFVGWQFQKNGISVQEVIEKSLKKIIKKQITIYGSGRTDAGVHAIEQSAHFKTEHKIRNKEQFIKSLNFFLSRHQVSILDIKKKNKLFHARYSAKKRTYKYIILNRLGSLALDRNKVWHLRKTLDVKAMRKGANLLVGTKDFSTFRSSSCSAKSPVKKIELVKIHKMKNKIEIIFVSQSFLQQQVRSMVGCLKYLGEKKWTLKKFKDVLVSKKRKNCAPPAPPEGLYLFKVKY